MGGGGAGANNVTEVNPIPEWCKDDVNKYLSFSRRYSNVEDPTFKLYEYTGPIPNESDTYATRNSDELDGIYNLADRARNSTSSITKARSIVQETIDGDDLFSNPKIDALYSSLSEELIQDFQENTLPSIETESLSINMYGSSGFAIRQASAAELILKNLLKVSKDVYVSDYNYERDRQHNSSGIIIPFALESTRDGELLRQAGVYEREYQQGILTARYREYYDDQMFLVRKLEVLGNGIRAVVGAQYRKVSEPFYRPSDMSQIAGIAMAGASFVASYYGSRPQQGSVNQSLSSSLPKPTEDNIQEIKTDQPEANNNGW